MKQEPARGRETSTPPVKSADSLPAKRVVGVSRDEALKRLISKSKRDEDDMEEDQTGRLTYRQSENISVVGEEELDWKSAQLEFVSGGRGEEERS